MKTSNVCMCVHGRVRVCVNVCAASVCENSILRHIDEETGLINLLHRPQHDLSLIISLL